MPERMGGSGGKFEGIIEGLNSEKESKRAAASMELLRLIENEELEISGEMVDALFNCVDWHRNRITAFINSLSWIAFNDASVIPLDKVHRIAVMFEELDPEPNSDGSIDIEDSILLIVAEIVEERDVQEVSRAIPAAKKYYGHEADLLREAARRVLAEWGYVHASNSAQTV